MVETEYRSGYESTMESALWPMEPVEPRIARRFKEFFNL
jgi:hypothetical protein